jgi:hypothetical protein
MVFDQSIMSTVSIGSAFDSFAPQAEQKFPSAWAPHAEQNISETPTGSCSPNSELAAGQWLTPLFIGPWAAWRDKMEGNFHYKTLAVWRENRKRRAGKRYSGAPPVGDKAFEK